jgi:RNA polymerase sigma-70 factor (ECF subfamily)
MSTIAANAGFDLNLKGILPQLRIYALSLTRNGDRADDLVQQTALKALSGRKSFRAGSNFGGWIFRIQRNEFISELRRNRPTVELDSAAARSVFEPPRQQEGMIFRELIGAFGKLTRGGREALLQAQLEGCSHEQIAARGRISVGTVKSRISRARATLTQLLDPAAIMASSGGRAPVFAGA